MVRATFSVKQVENARSSLDNKQVSWGPSYLITKLENRARATMRRRCHLVDVRLAIRGMIALMHGASSGVAERAIGWCSQIALAFGATKPLLSPARLVSKIVGRHKAPLLLGLPKNSREWTPRTVTGGHPTSSLVLIISS